MSELDLFIAALERDDPAERDVLRSFWASSFSAMPWRTATRLAKLRRKKRLTPGHYIE
jgi:hypothetical protein